MKYITIGCIFLLLLSSCNSKNINNIKSTNSGTSTQNTDIGNETTKDINTKKTLVYSNMTDIASQEEVKEAMKNAGIKDENIKNFFENVNDFNQTIGNNSLIKKGFVKSQNLQPKYDIQKNTELLDKKYPDFLGNNCRITSFSLMKNFIKIENPIYDTTESVIFDLDALQNTPYKFLSDSEKEEFKSFFELVNTPITKDLNVHLKNIQNNWKKKKVTFLGKNNPNAASLISVVMHSVISKDESYLFIGHMGVLIPTKENKLLFLEKLTFQDPYQAIKFNTRSELVDYLMQKYDIEYGQESARPFILENDQLIDGFRYNPNNKENEL